MLWRPLQMTATGRPRNRRRLRNAPLLTVLANAVLVRASLDPLTQCSPHPPVELRDAFLPTLSYLGAVCPPPIDDRASPETWTPWTHAPLCERTQDYLNKYCVYTNSRHGSRGWSILTTPEIAAGMPLEVLNQPLNVTNIGVSPNSGPNWKLVDIPGKGKGLVATRRLKQYDEIVSDYATIVVAVGFTTDVWAVAGYRLLDEATVRLSDIGLSVLGLSASNEHARNAVENVLRTNAFHTEIGGEPHMALYPTVSRINHACMPNAYTRFISESLQVSVAAAKDIEEGEEITISYLTLGKTSQERKEGLKVWGFECKCKLCTGSEAEVAASDSRRRQIAMLRKNAIAAFRKGKPYEALRFTRQVMKLLPSEELFPLYSEEYENLARIFWVLGDLNKSREYAKESLDIMSKQGYLGVVKEEHLEKMFKIFRQELGNPIQRNS